jgi:hypothetical protein
MHVYDVSSVILVLLPPDLSARHILAITQRPCERAKAQIETDRQKDIHYHARLYTHTHTHTHFTRARTHTQHTHTHTRIKVYHTRLDDRLKPLLQLLPKASPSDPKPLLELL